MNVKFTVLLLGLSLALTGVAIAQVPTATLVGRVTDPTKAALVGAKIEVRDLSTNSLRTATTGGQGEYTVSSLLPGAYEVTISHPGFKQLVESNLALSADQTVRLDAVLQIGGERIVVEVSDKVGAVNTETSSKGEVVSQVEIAEMPLNGRDFTDLALSVPGVMPEEEGGKGTAYTSNGARSDASNVLVEGLNNTNPRDAGAQATPPLDSLQEFKVQTSNYSAEYGRVAGAVINAVMKRGGNQLHGSVFEYLRNDLFDARSYFDSAQQKSELRRNQFGATLGGPVVIPHLYDGHDHTFFFASWESYREVKGANQIGVVPSLLERQGDFSQSFNVNTGRMLAPNSLKDPSAQGIVAHNKITNCLGNPAASIAPACNPVALSLLNFYPLPNLTGLGNNNYRAYAKNLNDWDNITVKGDQHLTAKDEFSARVLWRQQTSTDPFSGSDTALFGSTTKKDEILAGISETRIFTPTLINEFRLGITRMHNNETSLDAGTNWARMMGMCPSSDPKRCPTNDPAYAQFPLFKPTGYMTLGDSTQNPIRYTTNNYNLNDIATWNKGKHTFKFGGDILRVQYFQPTNSNFSGTLAFSGKTAQNSIAEFLVGIPSSISITEGSPVNHIYDTYYAAFVQDDFKALPSLTLNLGVRYELDTLPYEKAGQWSSYDPDLHQVIFAAPMTDALTARLSQYGNPAAYASAGGNGLPKTLIQPDYKRVAPRIGFAWRPFHNDRTVVRSGYGIFYTGSRLSALRTELSGKFPFSLPFSFSNKGVLTISNPFDIDPTVKGLNSVNGIDFNAKSSYLQSWNLTLENEIGKGVTVELGYTGSKGTHLGRQIDINQSVLGPDGNPMKPVDPNYSTINYFSFNSNSSYNAGILTVRRKFDHGLFFRASYTYGKSIDTASGLNYAGAGGFSGAQDSQNPNAERGRSGFDRRHIFTMNFVYKLPVNKTVLLRGWQLAGTGAIYSGAPFTPQLAGPSNDDGVATRPNRLSPGKINPYTGVACSSQFHRTPQEWFDLDCFPQVSNPNQIGLFGNSGRDILDGPGYVGIDLALSREFTIREKGRLQFRWEVFNFLNHTNFNLPNDNVDTAGAGTITSAKPNRIMQVAVKYTF
jgi:hypothetical protein